MAEKTEIAWCDSTFNPWIGCTKVGPGCDNCYAKADFEDRKHRVIWGAGNPRSRTAPANWKKPSRWNAEPFVECAQCGYRCELREFHAIDGPADFTMCPRCSCHDYHGARRRVFCASLADVFDNEVPTAWRQELMSLIVRTPNLDWLLLTKRIGNARRMLSDASMHDSLLLTANDEYRPPANLWIGATIVNQEEADRDIPKLLATPAAVRFLSMEPLLGPVDLRMVAVPPEQDQLRRPWDFDGSKFNALQLHDEDRFPQPPAAIDWVIAGGESGPGARPMHPDWARSLRDQCAAAGVPFLFKQWGEWLPWHQFVDGAIDDPPERTRFDTREWVDGAWTEVGRPDYWATMDGVIDDEQCVGRVGKKAAGRLLDGVEHNGFPQ